MKQRGYLMTCSRCGRQEFVSRDEDDLGGWMGLTLQRNKEEPLDICPACAKLFDTMAEIFVSSFANGILCYTMDGYPVIFDPDALAYREPAKNEEKGVDIPYNKPNIEPEKFKWSNVKHMRIHDVLYEKKVFEDPGVVNIHVEKEDEDDAT